MRYLPKAGKPTIANPKTTLAMKNVKIYEETLHHYGASLGEVRHEIIYSAYVSLIEVEATRTLRYLEAEKRRHGWDWNDMMETFLVFVRTRYEVAYAQFDTVYKEEDGNVLEIMKRLS